MKLKIEYTHQPSELVFDSLLKIFHRKNTFLRYIHANINGNIYFNEQETKRELLERIFPYLQSSDAGHRIIIKIGLEISEFKEFPDLYGFEDSQYRVNTAKESVKKLREYIILMNEEISKEQERKDKKEAYRIEVEKQKYAAQSLSKLEKSLYDLSPQIGTTEGGFNFERWFYDLLDFFEVQYRRSYRTSDKRQIDGSMSINGTDYLIELKYTKEQTSQVELDSIYAKLRSKADNTLAVCVSMSGFTQNAKDYASSGRTMILLLDHNHIALILRKMFTFSELIDRIKGHASQTGEAYLEATKI